jgi:hypothetical protein
VFANNLHIASGVVKDVYVIDKIYMNKYFNS